MNKEYPFKIGELVKGRIATLIRYRAQHLYYQVRFADVDYEFSVPIEDIGDATFNNEERAIMLMRYIRKAMEDGTLVKV